MLGRSHFLSTSSIFPSRGMSVRATALSPFCHFSHCSPQETSDLTAGRLVGQEAGHTLQTCKFILSSFSPGAPQQVVGYWVPTKSSSANPWRKPFLNPQMTQLYLLLYFGSLFIFIVFVLLYNNLHAYVLASSALLTATWGTLSLTLCCYAVGAWHIITPCDSVWNGCDVNFNRNAQRNTQSCCTAVIVITFQVDPFKNREI